MANNETTNVDHKIRACLATVEAEMKEFKPMLSTELAIRDYLKKNSTAIIKVEPNGPKELAALKAKRAKERGTSSRTRGE